LKIQCRKGKEGEGERIRDGVVVAVEITLPYYYYYLLVPPHYQSMISMGVVVVVGSSSGSIKKKDFRCFSFSFWS